MYKYILHGYHNDVLICKVKCDTINTYNYRYIEDTIKELKDQSRKFPWLIIIKFVSHLRFVSLRSKLPPVTSTF